jgi:hypothetical protein
MLSFKLRLAAAITALLAAPQASPAAAHAVSPAVANPAVADDTTAPTAPGTPVFSQVTQFGLTISWAPSTDDVGVANYFIRRNLPNGGTWNESTQGNVTTITIRDLTPNNNYTFSILAVDAAANLSPASASASVRTPAYTGGSMCSVSYQPLSSGGGTFFSQIAMTNLTPGAWQEWTLGFTLTPSQRVDPAWGFTRDGNRYTMTFVWLWSSGAGPLLPGATRSVQFSGSYTGTSNPPPTEITINDHPCVVPGETLPPGQPGDLTASNVTATSATLSWTASTTGSAPLSGYVIYRLDAAGEVAIRVVPAGTTSTTLTGLTPGTAYQLRVRARDSFNVLSGPSRTVSFTTRRR